MSARKFEDEEDVADVLDSWDADESSDETSAPLAASDVKVEADVPTHTTDSHAVQAQDVSDSSREDETDTSDDEDSYQENGERESSDGNYASQILDSYRKLLSRRVDLVGDYAGNELFLIEGDSLLLRCFSDPRIDFDSGFQMLHAAYNVEQLLHHLTQRRCNFHVVFFESNKKLCVPSTASEKNASRYLLARAAIKRHLKVNLPASHPNIEVKEFDAYTSTEFEEYLTLRSPYFVMAHDGAESMYRSGKHMAEATKPSPNAGRVALREMILFFIQRRLNVALINGLEWRDTKVMAMVLERRDRIVNHPIAHGMHGPSITAQPDGELKGLIEKLTTLVPHFSERQLATVVSAHRMLKAGLSYECDHELTHLIRSFLMQQALLAHLPLSARRLPSTPGTGSSCAQSFLQDLAVCTEAMLQDPVWGGTIGTHSGKCDLADFVDGRLFLQVSSQLPRLTLDMRRTFQDLAGALKHLTGDETLRLDFHAEGVKQVSNGMAPPPEEERSLAVLPFSNPVFDTHLASVRLQVDEDATDLRTPASHKIFREVTHWHNAKKPLIQRSAQKEQSAKQAVWADKRNQRFMAEMQKYAASLTNAVGRSLEPETIIVGAGGASKAKSIPPSASGRNTPDSDSTDNSSSSRQKESSQPKKGSGGKKTQQNARKEAMFNQTAAAKAKKDEATGDKIINSWHTVCKGFEADSDPRSRYRKANDYVVALPTRSSEVIAAECRLYMLNCLLQHWKSICGGNQDVKARQIEVASLIWHTCRTVLESSNLTEEIVSGVELTVKILGLPPTLTANHTGSLPSRKLAFAFALSTSSNAETLSVKLDPTDFQLLHCGPYLERSFDSKPDDRVDFNPDGWQREVLDGIDRNQSVFAVAPTSAGKTFISFYAMRKVLENDDDSVLVYVAPTKALVNQIAAEIQARYSKNFKYGGKSVWAIHTRDYRINNPTGCQVLVTVPHVLQIMLLAPTNTNSWSSRVKRIIFDEVHSIGQAEDGVIWEQLLLLAPCPIIALSATVGNPLEFSDWLAVTQKAIGTELVTVQHPYRYSDLRKYYYVPPEQFSFHGVPEKTAFGTLGLEHTEGLHHIHPVAALVDRSRGIPEDLSLEPRDCWVLYKALAKYATDAFPIPDGLHPKHALPADVKKVDVLKWERGLKEVLQRWIEDSASPYNQVVEELEYDFRNTNRESLQATHPEVSSSVMPTSGSSNLINYTLAMLCRLHEQDALPAILFNYDRLQCENICRAVMEQLQTSEHDQQKSGPKWQKKLERWEEWKKLQEKAASRTSKVTNKKASKKADDDDDGERTSKLDQQKDAAGTDASSWESFDPAAPITGYHFADNTRVLVSELEVYVRQLRRRDVQPWLIEALQRGIGVHHAGMNRKYRQVVEILFRKRFLRVVVATGTLALGINMPCKTVVFSGDSVFLTALNYRQCAGRAGRRGFDLLGNVVFQDVSREKVCRLISSRLPDLNGHFPISTTLVLRLFTLLYESKNSKYAISAINALLSQPRLYMGGPSFKDQTMHHLRFSIEYLRRQYLLSSNGAPLNFAGLVSHLYFTESSSFAFHALLKEGYLHQLCAAIETKEKDTLDTLMLCMAHIFNRIPCRQVDEEYKKKVVKPSSSIVFLPPMPEAAARILRQHNQQTLDVYQTYVETFVDQHVTFDDRKLPLTGMDIGAENDPNARAAINSLPTTKTRSAFVALSGASDVYDSISDLCQTTRDGVFLEEAVIPHVPLYPDDSDTPLNAWLLDFFRHGDVATIERANGVRRSDIWFMLNDFSLVLSTIIASLLNFMKLKEGTDMDMLDIMGTMDVREDTQDDKADILEQQSESGESFADSAISVPERHKPVEKKKLKQLEKWEDMADEEEAAVDAASRKATQIAAAEEESMESGAWSGAEGGKGLRNVLKAFTKLHADFNVKFRAMWA